MVLNITVFLGNSIHKHIFACRFRKKLKKREIFRLKKLKSLNAPFLETIPLSKKKNIYTLRNAFHVILLKALMKISKSVKKNKAMK